MSWSTSTPEPVAVADVGEAVASLTLTGVDEIAPEVAAQLQAAKDAAQLLVERGIVGEGTAIVSLSGHATPGFEAGDSKSSVTISVLQQT